MYLGGERVRLALRAVIAVFWDVVVLLLQQVPLKYKKPLKVLGLSAAVK